MRGVTKLVPLLLLIAAPAAFAQDITARFYPEKQEYVIGEPILVILEIRNNTSGAIEAGEDGCDWMHPDQFQVTNAPRVHEIGLFGCAPFGGIAGDCLSGAQKIPARGILQKRFLLNARNSAQFDLSLPGTYHLTARRTVTIYGKGGFRDVIENIPAENEFDITVREPEPGELQGLYQRFVKELSSHDYQAKWLAAEALTQNPPRFLEPVILALAGSSDLSQRFQSIQGLKHLATPAARAKLMEMASGPNEGLAQRAIPALGEIANPDDCSAMLKIAARWRQYTEEQAYMAAGRICGGKAIPILIGALRRADKDLAQGLAIALGNTASRDAIPPLIGLLGSPDEWVRRDAEGALFTLTHRSMQDVSTPAAAAQVAYGWRGWWFLNASSAQIYSPDQCPSAGN